MFIQFAMSFTKKSNGATCHDVKNSWVKLTKQYETWTDIKQSYMNDVVELFCNPIFLLISHMVRKKHQKSHHVRPVEGNRRAQICILTDFGGRMPWSHLKSWHTPDMADMVFPKIVQCFLNGDKMLAVVSGCLSMNENGNKMIWPSQSLPRKCHGHCQSPFNCKIVLRTVS